MIFCIVVNIKAIKKYAIVEYIQKCYNYRKQ